MIEGEYPYAEERLFKLRVIGKYMVSFYVDTCIYLNLWKKEIGFNGEPFWIFAKDFFEFANKNNINIFYSGFILKELLFILDDSDYIEKKCFMEENSMFCKSILSKEEYVFAQKLKEELNTNCSFLDIIHLVLAKKTNSVFISRDNELINIANQLKIIAKRPEEIINY